MIGASTSVPVPRRVMSACISQVDVLALTSAVKVLQRRLACPVALVLVVCKMAQELRSITQSGSVAHPDLRARPRLVLCCIVVLFGLQFFSSCRLFVRIAPSIQQYHL